MITRRDLFRKLIPAGLVAALAPKALADVLIVQPDISGIPIPDSFFVNTPIDPWTIAEAFDIAKYNRDRDKLIESLRQLNKSLRDRTDPKFFEAT